MHPDPYPGLQRGLQPAGSEQERVGRPGPAQVLYLFPLGGGSRATLLRQAAGRLADPTLLCQL